MLLFSTDIDGTIFDGPESASRFAGFWKEIRNGLEVPLLVYNTGRSLDDARNLVATTALPRPDYFICGVGTEISDEAASCLMDGWHDELEESWDFDAVFEVVSRQPAARPQPRECQNPFKCSWFWEDADRAAIRELTEMLARRGIRSQAIYSSNRDLDFVPEKANKGNAAAWLANRLGIPAREVVVAGDSGNDASMFHIEEARGILVANAEPVLVETVACRNPYRAKQPCTAGVIEGLAHLLNQSTGESPGERGTP